jgi:hypothetical protein
VELEKEEEILEEEASGYTAKKDQAHKFHYVLPCS